jgi:hypothetical protein
MKYILTETQLKLLVEQSNVSSAASCDKNIAKGAGYLNNWKSMDENKRKELVKLIKNYIDQTLNKSKEEYIKWFQHPETIQKFKTPEEKEVLKKLPSYLQSINTAKLSFQGAQGFPGARAWVTPTTEPTVINYNISQLHDGNNFQGQSIEYTTKHEMGHLIDNFFQKNGVQTYLETTNDDIGTGYTDNYLINDKDQYTRLNVLRGIVGAGPNDHPITLLNKFLAQVKAGKITSDKFNFSSISSPNGMSQKNNMQQSTEVNKVLNNTISVDGKPNLNIEQLFSNFGLIKNGNVYVSFDLLAQFNLTSKDLEKKYYFLKMTPK